MAQVQGIIPPKSMNPRLSAGVWQALGMRLPAAKLTAPSICAALGPDYEAVTMNVMKQVLNCKLTTPNRR